MIDEPYKYTGKKADTSGLYFYESRYYDPVLGTYASRDAIAPDMTDSQSVNRYAYALNNPVNYVDRPDISASILVHFSVTPLEMSGQQCSASPFSFLCRSSGPN